MHKILAVSLLLILPSYVSAADYDPAPPDELVTGSANAAMRASIRAGANCYQWGPLRACDGPPEPFGSYAQDRGSDVAGGGGDDVGGSADSNDAGGAGSGDGTGSGSGDGGSGAGGGSGSSGGGAGQGRGAECRP